MVQRVHNLLSHPALHDLFQTFLPLISPLGPCGPSGPGTPRTATSRLTSPVGFSIHWVLFCEREMLT